MEQNNYDAVAAVLPGAQEALKRAGKDLPVRPPALILVLQLAGVMDFANGRSKPLTEQHELRLQAALASLPDSELLPLANQVSAYPLGAVFMESELSSLYLRGRLMLVQGTAGSLVSTARSSPDGCLTVDPAYDSEEHFWEFVEKGIAGVHRTEPVRWEWQDVKEMPDPRTPEHDRQRETAARQALEDFRPGCLARLLGGAGRERARLATELNEALQEGEQTFKALLEQFEIMRVGVPAARQMASSILERDQEAVRMAVEHLPLVIPHLPTLTPPELRVSSIDATTLRVSHVVLLDAVIPTTLKVSGARGGSSKPTPKKRRNEALQDYVCGSALRVGQDLLAAFDWLDDVIVDVFSADIDSSTGRTVERCLLSVEMPRSTIAGLVLAKVDASDAVEANFRHSMDFGKLKGLQPVDPLQ